MKNFPPQPLRITLSKMNRSRDWKIHEKSFFPQNNLYSYEQNLLKIITRNFLQTFLISSAFSKVERVSLSSCTTFNERKIARK